MPIDPQAYDRINGANEGRNGNGGVDHSQPVDLSWMKPVSARQLMVKHPDLKPVLISGMLRVGETGTFIAGPKARKSLMILGLAFSIAQGSAWLGLFATAKGRVLIIDNELHAETLAHRIKHVASAMGAIAAIDAIDVICMRGIQVDINQLEAFIRTIRKGEYQAIFLDAIYKSYPEGMSENDNALMSRFYGRIDHYAMLTGSAFVCVHHTSRGPQGSKIVTDVGAGAGAGSRAPDSYIVCREHEEKDCIVFEGALRSFPPFDPFGARFGWPIWTADSSIDVTKIRRENKGGRPRKEQAEKPPVEVWTPEKFAASFVGEAPVLKSVMISKAERAAVPSRHIAGLIAEAEAAGLIHQHHFDKKKAIFYATVPQQLFGKAPEIQMEAAEAKKALKMLCGLFPNRITDEQGSLIRTSLRRLSYDAAADFIKSYAAHHEAFDLPRFLHGLDEKYLRARPPTPPR